MAGRGVARLGARAHGPPSPPKMPDAARDCTCAARRGCCRLAALQGSPRLVLSFLGCSSRWSAARWTALHPAWEHAWAQASAAHVRGEQGDGGVPPQPARRKTLWQFRVGRDSGRGMPSRLEYARARASTAWGDARCRLASRASCRPPPRRACFGACLLTSHSTCLCSREHGVGAAGRACRQPGDSSCGTMWTAWARMCRCPRCPGDPYLHAGPLGILADLSVDDALLRGETAMR